MGVYLIWKLPLIQRQAALHESDELAAYRKTGRGWQTRINADLRRAAKKLTG
jgi:uncharacterized protein (DUF4415 family)